MTTSRWCVIVCFLVTLATSSAQSQRESFRPKEGFVPDDKTALAVGQAILTAAYGEHLISSEMPLVATLHGSIWVVEGTSKTALGGVAQIKISKSTGQVLVVSHGK